MRKNKTKGNVLIEVALFMPLFLTGLLFLLWLGVIANAKSSLMSAVDIGTRLAATRGARELYDNRDAAQERTGAIPDLDKWKQFGSLSRKELLAGPEGGSITPGDPSLQPYDHKVKELFNKAAPGFPVPAWQTQYQSLQDMPVEYAYAITYIVQNLRLSVSENLRYPCDPYNTDGTDPDNGENCLLCRPVSPNSPELKDVPYQINGGFSEQSLIETRIAIRCDYKPSGFLLKPMLAMMSVVTGRPINGAGAVGVVSHASFFGRDSKCQFIPGVDDGTTVVPPKYCCDNPGDSRPC